MYVREDELFLSNLICKKVTIPYEQWVEPVMEFRREIIRSGLVYSGLVIFSAEELAISPGVFNFSFYIQIRNPLPEVDRFEWTDINCERALSVRCDSSDDWEDAYQAIRDYAEESNIELTQPFYHVTAEVFGDTVTDIIAPY